MLYAGAVCEIVAYISCEIVAYISNLLYSFLKDIILGRLQHQLSLELSAPERL
jgi:hypothetical protein